MTPARQPRRHHARTGPRAAYQAGLLFTALAWPQAQALDWSVVERAEDGVTVLSQHQVTDILGVDAAGAPQLRLDPSDYPQHQAFIDVLAPVLSMDDPTVRDFYAEILARFPQPCRDHGRLAITVAPPDAQEQQASGPLGARAVTGVQFSGCVSPVPAECQCQRSATRSCNAGMGGLMHLLHDCRGRLQDARSSP